jgi:transketolase
MVIVSSDCGAPVLDSLREQSPERLISVGIAEQNLIQVSCGLALAGKRVIAYGQVPFTSTRAFDQIRNGAALMNLPINHITTDAGFSFSEYGASHYNTDDISLMRTIPCLRILNITDEVMAVKAADYALMNETPLYIRFDKASEGIIYQQEEIDFIKGYKVFTQGNDVAVISYGYHFKKLLDLRDRFAEKGIAAKIIDLYAIPFDHQSLLSEILDVKSVVTIEEHVLPGGIGSAILELLSDNDVCKKVKRLGVRFKNEYPSTFGSRGYYVRQYGLSEEQILNDILNVI